jgi:hypothetical protein
MVCLWHSTEVFVMLPPFDIMRIAPNEDLMLIEAAESLEVAMVRAVALRDSVPGDYIVVSQVTGKKLLFTAGGGITRI